MVKWDTPEDPGGYNESIQAKDFLWIQLPKDLNTEYIEYEATNASSTHWVSS